MLPIQKSPRNSVLRNTPQVVGSLRHRVLCQSAIWRHRLSIVQPARNPKVTKGNYDKVKTVVLWCLSYFLVFFSNVHCVTVVCLRKFVKCVPWSKHYEWKYPIRCCWPRNSWCGQLKEVVSERMETGGCIKLPILSSPGGFGDSGQWWDVVERSRKTSFVNLIWYCATDLFVTKITVFEIKLWSE